MEDPRSYVCNLVIKNREEREKKMLEWDRNQKKDQSYMYFFDKTIGENIEHQIEAVCKNETCSLS